MKRLGLLLFGVGILVLTTTKELHPAEWPTTARVAAGLVMVGLLVFMTTVATEEKQ